MPAVVVVMDRVPPLPSAGWTLCGVAQQRAGHAVATAPSATELRAVEADDLDAVAAHQGVRVLVALVRDYDPGLQRDDVVAVVPLLALGLPGVAAGADDAQLLDLERVRDGAQERVLAAHVELALAVRRPDRVGRDRVDHARVHRHAVAV